MKNLLAILLLTSCAFANVEIHDLRSGEKIDQETFLQRTPAKGTIVLGEEHYNLPIQKAEGDLIKSIVLHHRTEGRFAVTWEFLNYPDQKEVDIALKNWKSDDSTPADFLLGLFKNENTARKHQIYFPFLESVKLFDGSLIAGNAPREWKKIITTKGISELDPKLVPQNCTGASENYRERFAFTMRDHVPEEALERYLEAQYFTDCVLAQTLSTVPVEEQKFLIVGSFHCDYNDGVIPWFEQYSGGEVITIKLVNANKLSDEEVAALLEPHPKYGRIADFIYLIRDL